MLDPDPLAAMYAAVLAIADGEVGEIEIDWAVESDGMECRLSVVVRREVRQFVVEPDPTEGPVTDPIEPCMSRSAEGTRCELTLERDAHGDFRDAWHRGRNKYGGAVRWRIGNGQHEEPTDQETT